MSYRQGFAGMFLKESTKDPKKLPPLTYNRELAQATFAITGKYTISILKLKNVFNNRATFEKDGKVYNAVKGRGGDWFLDGTCAE